MNAAVIRRFTGPENLETVELHVSEPGPEPVRIRLAASPVTPIDAALRDGRLAATGLISDASAPAWNERPHGVVHPAGRGVERSSPGDQIVALRDLLHTIYAAHAEYVVVDESAVAHAWETSDR